MSKFSERLQAQIQAAKGIVQKESVELVPASQVSAPQKSFANNERRLAHLRDLANQVAQSVLDTPEAHRAIQDVRAHVASRQPGSPPGLFAFFSRLGAQARNKYNQAIADETRSFISLQGLKNEATAAAIRSAYELEQLPDDIAMDMLLKEVVKRTSLTMAIGQEALLKEALDAGWSNVMVYEDLKKQVAMEEIRLTGKKQEEDIRLSAREVEFQQDISKDEFFRENARKDEDQRAVDKIKRATEAANARRLMERQLREELDDAIAKKHHIKNYEGLDDEARTELLANAQADIDSLKRQIDELSGRPGETGTEGKNS